MFGWVARMLAVAALAPLALPAHAVADESFTTTGSITYTWLGDPARGCAAVGVCGVQGALILRAQGNASSSSSGGPPRGPIAAPIEPSGSTVRVADGPGSGVCVDVASNPEAGGDLVIGHGARGGLVGRIAGSLSSGRCAGPREQDLAGIALPVRRSGGKRPTFDLSATRSFAVGPFTGTLVSTLVVRTGTGGNGSGSSILSPLPVAPAPTHKVLLEQVMLRYRIASLPGTLDASFSGEPDPFCTALDSCGATGTLAVSLPHFRRTLVVQASRTVEERVGARRAQADFRQGLLHTAGVGIAPFSGGSGARVAETFAGSDGLRCQDMLDSRQPQLFVVAGPVRSGGGVSIVLNNGIGSGLLRTYCPGPSDTDVFGSLLGVARTSIGVAQLLHRHSVISLSAPGTFAGLGYVGSRSGALRFSLTLERVRAGTVEVMRP